MAPQRLEDLTGEVYANKDGEKAARQAREIAARAKTKAEKTPEKPQDAKPPSGGKGKAPETQQRAPEAGSRAVPEVVDGLETMPEGEAEEFEDEGTQEKETPVYPLDVEKTRAALEEMVEDEVLPGLEAIAGWTPQQRAQARAWAASLQAGGAPDLPAHLAEIWGVPAGAGTQADEKPAAGEVIEAEPLLEEVTAQRARLPEGATLKHDGQQWLALAAGSVGAAPTPTEAVDNLLAGLAKVGSAPEGPSLKEVFDGVLAKEAAEAKTDPVAPAGEQGELFETAPEPVKTVEPGDAEMAELFEIHQSIREAQTEVLEAKQELEASKAKLKDREQVLAARFRELNDYVGDMSRGQRHIVAPPSKAKPLPLVAEAKPAEPPQAAAAESTTSSEAPEPAPLKLHVPPEDESWRDTSLIAVDGIGETIGQKLAEAGLTTVGELADWSAGKAMGKEGARTEGRQITWIKGIGPETAEKIENALLEYHKKRSRTVDIVSEGA